MHRAHLIGHVGSQLSECGDLPLNLGRPALQPVMRQPHDDVQCGDTSGLVVADPGCRLGLAADDVVLGLLLGSPAATFGIRLRLPASGCKLGLHSLTPARGLRIQTLALLPGLMQQPISLGVGALAQRGALPLGADPQLGGLILGHLQHALDPGARHGHRGPLQAIDLSGRFLGFATQTINLPGRLGRFTTQLAELLVEVGEALQRRVAFGPDRRQASLEGADVIDDLLAVEPPQHDLERRVHRDGLVAGSVHAAGS